MEPTVKNTTHREQSGATRAGGEAVRSPRGVCRYRNSKTLQTRRVSRVLIKTQGRYNNSAPPTRGSSRHPHQFFLENTMTSSSSSSSSYDPLSSSSQDPSSSSSSSQSPSSSSYSSSSSAADPLALASADMASFSFLVSFLRLDGPSCATALFSFTGDRSITMRLPSIDGDPSRLHRSAPTSSTKRMNMSRPRSRNSFSLPRNWQMTFTRSPEPRNFCAALSLTP
mmetsp:Transcript_12335/g.49495  ORF Transcript_12335/g.49495 Transcript_12335/m.49495 type:complete len:225 (+) Transcript_12335:1638-2312(+)